MNASPLHVQFRRRIFVAVLCVTSCCAGHHRVLAENDFEFRKQIAIRIDGAKFADYVYSDSKISRPYFCDVFSQKGVQVTRNHPPRSADKDDHATMHPGIWLSFGDISGNDYWRLRAETRHVRFIESPTVTGNRATFTVENAYMSADGETIVCTEQCRYDIHASDAGILLISSSDFSADQQFYFGDQEEMGLGIRLATDISVDRNKGGRILDSQGRRNGDEVWGKQSQWCDYSGLVDASPVGMAIFPDPQNFRESWWHARDYGFVAANPFGKAAFENGRKSKIIVQPGMTFRIRFGIFVHDDLGPNSSASIESAYAAFLAHIEQ